MADEVVTDDQGHVYKNGIRQTSSSPSPDIAGAIQTAIAALAQHLGRSIAPSIPARPAAVEAGVNGQPPLGSQF
jgi:hypothetical protein